MELTLNVNIIAPNLCNALLRLAAALRPDSCTEEPAQAALKAPETRSTVKEVEMPASVQKPVETPAQPVTMERETEPAHQPAVSPAPIVSPAAAPAASPAVPDAPAAPETPVYTLEQLSRAGAALATSGKMPELMALMQKHGVQALTQLKPDQYPAMADDLRSMGAQI